VSVGDRWLKGVLPKVFSSAAYRRGRTAVFLTWDEDDNSEDNHIATFVMTPSVKPGTTSAGRFDHCSMLRTTEQMLGLGLLGHAKTAIGMRGAFNV